MSPLSLEEIKAKENVLYPNREAKKVISKNELKTESKIITSKKCNSCQKVKDFSEFKPSHQGKFGYSSKCKECLKIEEEESIDTAAKKIWSELPNLPESKEEFTIEYIRKRFGISKSRTSQALKKLDDEGLLTHVYKARTKYYSIVKQTTKKDSYEPITEALPKSKPKLIPANINKIKVPAHHNPEQSIIQTVKVVYNNAESIEINPQTNEIHIKMKG